MPPEVRPPPPPARGARFYRGLLLPVGSLALAAAAWDALARGVGGGRRERDRRSRRGGWGDRER